jgi:hypothetical protein
MHVRTAWQSAKVSTMLLRTAFATIRLVLLVSLVLITGRVVSQIAPPVTLSASPTSIPNDESSTLAWTSANATSCSGTGKGFSPSNPSGSLTVSPKATTIYDITCTGAGGSASQSATVTVTAAATLAIGMTVATPGAFYVWPTPSTGIPSTGAEAQGNQGTVIGGPGEPVGDMVASILLNINERLGEGAAFAPTSCSFLSFGVRAFAVAGCARHCDPEPGVSG